tara:strand:- start:3908 stop:4975 length:1068 start_codon:yes stop_codon:yes gene_type:complete
MENLDKLNKFWKNKKVFITGHTGFKGSWLSLILNMLGSNIYGYSLKPKKSSLFNQADCKSFLKKNIYADINNFNLLKKELKKINPQILFHLAAQPLVSDSFKNPIGTLKTNIIGTSNILDIIKNIKSLKSVVIITTDKVYKIKKNNKSYSEIDHLGGKDPYSVSKVCAELVTDSFANSFFEKSFLKNKVSTARSGNVIGGGDYSKNRLLPDIIKSVNTKKILVIRNPNHIRPWQHVIEPLVGYMKLAEKQSKSKKLDNYNSWNFGPKKENFVKVIYIVNLLKKRFNLNIKIRKKQKFSETKILKLNSKKSNKKLKWYNKWNLEKSLKKVMEWNELFYNNVKAKQICEKQIREYFK